MHLITSPCSPFYKHNTIILQTSAGSKTNPTDVDGDDSRNIAIIYGSLGILIAFASLVVAVLSWLRSHRQRLVIQHRANNDMELQSSTSQHLARQPGECQHRSF
jgi:hypothetical protein